MFTPSASSQILGEDEDWLQELSITIDPEDDRLYVHGMHDETITAFTEDGIENLREITSIARHEV